MSAVKSRARDALLPFAGRMARTARDTDGDAILIFQPDHLGDILLAQVAVRHLRAKMPDRRLIAVVGPWSRAIASIAWPVDEIVTVPFPGFTRAEAGSPLAPYHRLWGEARRLRRVRAGAAYVLRPDAWWAAWLAALVAPVVVAADDPRTGQFATRAVPTPEDEHAVVRAFRIAASDDPTPRPSPLTSPLELPELPDARDAIAGLFGKSGACKNYIVIHSGSGAAVKEWPIHRWTVVAGILSRRGFQIVLTGTASESAACDEIAARVACCVSMAGKTPLPVLAELLRGAAIAIGPDSGPLHLAVAVGTPTVHLFGPSDPGRYGPWGDPRRHLVVRAGWSCPRCGDLSPERATACGCMLAIKPSDVIAACESILSANAD